MKRFLGVICIFAILLGTTGCVKKGIPNDKELKEFVNDHNLSCYTSSREEPFLHFEKFEEVEEYDDGFVGSATLNNKIDEYYSIAGTIKLYGKYDSESHEWRCTKTDTSLCYKKLTYNVEGSWYTSSWWNNLEITNQTETGMDVYIDEHGFGDGAPVHVEAIAYDEYTSAESSWEKIIFRSEVDEYGRADVEVCFIPCGDKGLSVVVSEGIYDYEARILKKE